MTRVVVAGVVSVRVACRVPSFPVPFVASQRNDGGVDIRLGSTGWTAARTLRSLGTGVSLATYVGADPLGQFAIRGLCERGLYSAATLVCPTQPRTVVLYDRDGGQSSIRDHSGTRNLLYPTEVFTATLDAGPACDLAMLTSVQFARALVGVTEERDIPVATDLHLVEGLDRISCPDLVRVAHIVACSHERLPVSPEEWVRQLWNRFATQLVLIGCGAAGAVLGILAAQEIWRIEETTPRGVAYTAGAGDTLLASFVHYYLARGDPLVAARHAVLAAGWAIGSGPDQEPDLTARTLAQVRAQHGLPAIRRLR